MRFLHAADLHIDSPLRGLDAHEGAPVERLRGATRQAFVALVDLALTRQVDLVILAGDIYDGDWHDFHTGLFFHSQMVRLSAGGIPVFIARGNHDAESQITRQLPSLEGIHVFSTRHAETRVLDELNVAVHGRSFARAAVSDDLAARYPGAVPGRFNIGVLHTSLSGSPDHDPYAPTTVDTLERSGYDYWALGHIHARQVVRERGPRIVFPGNLQGRHARETGPKGCELVTVEAGAIVATESVALDVVRWHRLSIDIDGLTTLDALDDRVGAALAARVNDAPERLHVARVRLQGRSVLQQAEARQPGTLAAAVRASALRISNDLWIEQVESVVCLPLDRTALAARADAVGEIVRQADQVAGTDDASLRQWALAALVEAGGLPHLPRDLADLLPEQIDPAQWRVLLADAEAMVLAHLLPALAAEEDADPDADIDRVACTD